MGGKGKLDTIGKWVGRGGGREKKINYTQGL